MKANLPNQTPTPSLGGVAAQVERLVSDFKVRPITAAEIEFYMPGSDACASLPAFWAYLGAMCRAQGITVNKTEKEKGKEQHEVSITPSEAPKTAQDIEWLKTIINDAAGQNNMKTNFAARPFADQPGSGLHIHVHLTDLQDRNVFYKDDIKMSDMLRFSIGGLLTTMRENMNVFAPRPESRNRFVAGSNAPLTVSWGANNRTVAIRLPDSAHDNKRIEHRVAGADADPERVIAAILAGIHFGLKNRCNPIPQIFGDAALEMYKLEPLL